MSAKASASPSVAPASGPRASTKGRRKRKAERKKARATERSIAPRASRSRTRAAEVTPAAPEVAPSAVATESPALDDLDFDLVFFDSIPPTPAATPIEEDPDLAPLTPLELGRRLRFRRHVLRAMAALGAFSAVVTAIRVAALL